MVIWYCFQIFLMTSMTTLYLLVHSGSPRDHYNHYNPIAGWHKPRKSKRWQSGKVRLVVACETQKNIYIYIYIHVSAYEISEQSCSMANPRFSMNFMVLAGTPHKISWFQSFFNRQSNGYCDYQVKQPNGLCTLGKDRPEICPDFVKETLLLRLRTCEPGMHVSQALVPFSSWLHGFVWKRWVNIPNEIAIFHRDNDH